MGPCTNQNSILHFTLRQEKTHILKLIETRRTLEQSSASALGLSKFSAVSYPVTPVPMELGNETNVLKNDLRHRKGLKCLTNHQREIKLCPVLPKAKK